MNQTITSASTSINSAKVPAVFKKVSDWHHGQLNLDLGGGRYDTATNYLLREYGTYNLVLDPYNRTQEHNDSVRWILELSHGADSCTISNVLNVIREPEARREVLEQARELTWAGAPVYITVYEGDRSGVGRQTGSDSWQENRKLASYLEEVREVFPEAEVRNGMIIARR